MINIAILGSTGSIGKSTLNIIRKNKKKFKVILLSANVNGKTLFKQAKEFKVKNVIILNTEKNKYWIAKFHNKKIKTFDNFSKFNKIFKKKIDHVINGISGLDGLKPTLDIIKHTNKIAIANKESIICGWNLILKELKQNNTKFIPLDSEHFSLNKLLKNYNNKDVKKIIITASGGPFLNKKINNKKIKIKEALKHPNWKMGKKITIDSSTLMNKVFEVIEAKKIFNIELNKIQILINPNSYIHAIIIINNGTIKFLAHENKMDIPIYNSIFEDASNNHYKNNYLNLKKLNNLNLLKPDTKKFNLLKILKLIPQKDSLFETVVISVNDELVNKFLSKKIDYKNISHYLMKIINFKKFKKYCKVKPKTIKQIIEVRNLARLTTNEFINKFNLYS